MVVSMDFNTQSCPWSDYTVIAVMSQDNMSSCRIYIYPDEPHVAVISDLYVDEKVRGQGRATELLDYCAEIVKPLKCTEIQLRSDTDDWVRQWYLRKGFEVISSQVWLRKNIE